MGSRERFFDMLGMFPDVKIVPATLDLSESRRYLEKTAPKNMRAVLYEHAAKCVYPTMKDQVRLLGRQFANVSFQQMLRMLTLASCVKLAIQHMVIFLSMRKYWSCYESMSFTIDKLGSGNREEKLLDFLLFSWIAAWSSTEPLELIREIHTSDHPFVRKYETDGGVDLTRLMRGNIKYVSSESSRGLQMVDIVANTLYGVVNDLSNTAGMLPFWKRILKNCCCGPAMGPNLIVADNAGLGRRGPEPNLSKYRVLSVIMEAV